MKMHKALLILAVAASDISLYADRIPVSQAPAAVQEAIRSRAGVHHIEDVDRNLRSGQVVFEADWRDNGGALQQLAVSEAGTVLRDVVAPNVGLAQENLTLANRVGVALPETPPAVQTAIHNRIPDAPIDGIQRGIWNGQNIYEVTYHDTGKLKTFQVTETGQPVVSPVPAINETAATQAVAAVATTEWEPRYSGLATENVPLASGAKMAFHSAPRPVQETVNQLANGARIEDFERGLWNDHAVYQASFKRDGQMVELQILDDGTLVSNPPFGAGQQTAAALTPPPARPLPPNGIPPTRHSGLPNEQVGVPNTAAASTQPRFAGLADYNVQLEGVSKMSLASAPLPVQRTIAEVSNGARIEDLELGNWNGQVVYQAAFRRGGQNIQVQVLDDGSVLTKGPGNAVGGPAIGTSGTGAP